MENYFDTSQQQEGPWTCTICGEGLPSQGSLRVHTRGHDDEKLFKCPQCPMAFVSKEGLNSHGLVHRVGRPLKCRLCDFHAANQKHLVRHIVAEHPSKGPSNVTRVTIRVQQTEQNQHAQRNVHNQNAEGKVHNRSAQGNVHNQNAHGNVHNRKALGGGSRAHDGDMRLLITSHVKEDRDIVQFKCTLCDKTFLQEHQLQVHVQSNCDLEPFACDVCGKRFGQLALLTQHAFAAHDTASVLVPRTGQQEHGGKKKPVTKPCSIKCHQCDKTLPSRGLKAHLLRHAAVKQFQCPSCPEIFRFRQELLTHQEKAHDWSRAPLKKAARRYECPKCDRVFSMKYPYDVHTRSHAGLKLFDCDVCHAKFRHKATLARHQRMFHQVPVQMDVQTEFKTDVQT